MALNGRHKLLSLLLQTGITSAQHVLLLLETVVQKKGKLPMLERVVAELLPFVGPLGSDACSVLKVAAAHSSAPVVAMLFDLCHQDKKVLDLEVIHTPISCFCLIELVRKCSIDLEVIHVSVRRLHHRPTHDGISTIAVGWRGARRGVRLQQRGGDGAIALAVGGKVHRCAGAAAAPRLRGARRRAYSRQATRPGPVGDGPDGPQAAGTGSEEL